MQWSSIKWDVRRILLTISLTVAIQSITTTKRSRKISLGNTNKPSQLQLYNIVAGLLKQWQNILQAHFRNDFSINFKQLIINLLRNISIHIFPKKISKYTLSCNRKISYTILLYLNRFCSFCETIFLQGRNVYGSTRNYISIILGRQCQPYTKRCIKYEYLVCFENNFSFILIIWYFWKYTPILIPNGPPSRKSSTVNETNFLLSLAGVAGLMKDGVPGV